NASASTSPVVVTHCPPDDVSDPPAATVGAEPYMTMRRSGSHCQRISQQRPPPLPQVRPQVRPGGSPPILELVLAQPPCRRPYAPRGSECTCGCGRDRCKGCRGGRPCVTAGSARPRRRKCRSAGVRRSSAAISGQLVVGEFGAQVFLGDLAGGGHRQRLDEHHVIGQLPLGDP